MPKRSAVMSALEVAAKTEPGFYFVGGVAGLALQVQTAEARSWVLRITIGSKRRDMGLGAFPEVTLERARVAAAAARDQVKSGVDPIQQALAAKSALKATQATARTFKQCAEAYMAAHESGWKSAKHGQQWKNTLETHAYPVMGKLLVADVKLAHVLQVLEPIWTTTNETAVRVRGRIELVLDWATARELREGLNPARWRGHLDKLLVRPSKVNNRQHHPALSVADMGEFMARLRQMDGMGALALEFTILTAARSGEVRGATWAEIDLENKVWTVPADRMKAGKEHRVPLSMAALAVLERAGKRAGTDYLFPSTKGLPLSDMTLAAVLRRMSIPAVPHGFRSTFRDWASERTNYPREAAEMALAHVIGDKVEAAYRRGDLFDKRRKMMNDWAAFAEIRGEGAKVVPILQKWG